MSDNIIPDMVSLQRQDSSSKMQADEIKAVGYFQSGNNSLREGHLQSALTNFYHCTMLDSCHAKAYFNMAAILVELNERILARKLFFLSICIQPSFMLFYSHHNEVFQAAVSLFDCRRELQELQNKPIEQTTITTQEKSIESSFIGQKHMLPYVKTFIRKEKQNLRLTRAPMVMVFYGPSGTGKTEMARQIARLLHCKEENKINDNSDNDNSDNNNNDFMSLEASGKIRTFSMSQYKTKDSVVNFFGPDEGLKGNSSLYSALSKREDVVILLDEIEKAHPSLCSEIGMRVFDDFASLSFRGQKPIETRRATFILTTNLGKEEVMNMWRQDENMKNYDWSIVPTFLENDNYINRNTLKEELNPFSRPELRSRVCCWIPFLPYKPDELQLIISVELKRIQLHVRKSHMIDIYWIGNEVAASFISCYRADTGVRQLLKKVATSISSLIEVNLNNIKNTAFRCVLIYVDNNNPINEEPKLAMYSLCTVEEMKIDYLEDVREVLKSTGLLESKIENNNDNDNNNILNNNDNDNDNINNDNQTAGEEECEDDEKIGLLFLEEDKNVWFEMNKKESRILLTDNNIIHEENKEIIINKQLIKILENENILLKDSHKRIQLFIILCILSLSLYSFPILLSYLSSQIYSYTTVYTAMCIPLAMFIWKNKLSSETKDTIKNVSKHVILLAKSLLSTISFKSMVILLLSISILLSFTDKFKMLIQIIIVGFAICLL